MPITSGSSASPGLPSRTNRGQQSTPLVIDGVDVCDQQLRTCLCSRLGKRKSFGRTTRTIDGSGRYACCDAVNRGLAAFEGRLYVGASTAGCMRSMRGPAKWSGRSTR